MRCAVLSVCQTRARGMMKRRASMAVAWPERTELQSVCDLYYWAAEHELTNQPTTPTNLGSVPRM